jgi:predicted DNA binding protein
MMFRIMTIEIPAKILVDYGIIPSLPPVEKVDIVSVLKMRHDSVELICRVRNPVEGYEVLKENFRDADLDLLSSADGEETYCVKYKVPHQLIDMLLGFDMYIHYPMTYSKGRFVLTFIGRSEELARFLKLLEENGTEFTLVSVKGYSPDEMNVSLLSLLSPAQKKLLVLATQCGYFDLPRRADTRELGRITGLEPSTVSEHLRRGQGKIFAHLFAPYIDRTD